MGIPGWWSSPANGEGPTKTRLRDRHQGTDEDLDTREAAAAAAQSTPPESKAAPRARSRESERGEGREEMLDLDRSLVAMELSGVFDYIAVDHDTPFTIFVRSSLLRRPLDVWREEEGVRGARIRSSSSLPRWRVAAASRRQA